MIKSIEKQCECAFNASHVLSNLKSTKKKELLEHIANQLILNESQILKSNTIDIENGKKNGLSGALLDRLSLNKERIQDISNSIKEIAQLADPIGEIIENWTRPNGLKIEKIRVPLGVVGMIYEARPNVTADALAIGIKTGNAIVLRGSASAYYSNFVITEIFKKSLETFKINHQCIQLLEDTTRESVQTFVQMKQYLSLIIPRGGAGLIQSVVNTATVPTVETGVGNCHIFVDESAALDEALAIVNNAKTQRPSVCNACETLIVHQNIANSFLPKLEQLFLKSNVIVKACPRTKTYYKSAEDATLSDWDTEYLNLTLAVKVVDSLKEAIEHIQKHGTLHTEAILSQSKENIKTFKQLVDASAILVNASTRFTDGGEFGFGAEIGISTQKLHARGPMGIKELTTYKYIVEGSGQIR